MSLPWLLVLTPMKNTAAFINSCFAGLLRLDLPMDLISVAVPEGDSTDGAGRHHHACSRLPDRYADSAVGKSGSRPTWSL